MEIWPRGERRRNHLELYGNVRSRSLSLAFVTRAFFFFFFSTRESLVLTSSYLHFPTRESISLSSSPSPAEVSCFEARIIWPAIFFARYLMLAIAAAAASKIVFSLAVFSARGEHEKFCLFSRYRSIDFMIFLGLKQRIWFFFAPAFSLKISPFVSVNENTSLTSLHVFLSLVTKIWLKKIWSFSRTVANNDDTERIWEKILASSSYAHCKFVDFGTRCFPQPLL